MPDVKKEVEALLFSSGKLMTSKELSEKINAAPRDVNKALEALRKDYESRDTSLVLMQSGDGWKLNVKEQYTPVASKVVADTEMPKPVIMTLSVIAHKAPANQADVIKARGTNAYDHIQSLIDGGFVERKKHGRSFQIVLTPKFFDYFDVEGDQKLRMLFKDVRPSEPKRKKLGKLDVVDVPEAEKKTLESAAGPSVAGLEVFDVPPTEQDRPKSEPFKADNNFLDEMDEKIARLSKRNDDNDEDELLKRPGVAGEDGEAPAEGVRSRSDEIFGSKKADDEEPDSEGASPADEEAEKKDGDGSESMLEDNDKPDF